LSLLRVRVLKGETDQAFQMPGMPQYVGPGTKDRD
jgi:hypothetical protein